MPAIDTITDPKKVFLELHPEEATLFRTFVVSGAFRLAITSAMASFQSECPSQERSLGAKQFMDIFQTIAEQDAPRSRIPQRTLPREADVVPGNKFVVTPKPSK